MENISCKKYTNFAAILLNIDNNENPFETILVDIALFHGAECFGTTTQTY